MADIYVDLSAMVVDLLKPSGLGGFGQVPITLRRTTPGIPDPAQPAKRVDPVVQLEALQAAMQGVIERGEGTANISSTMQVSGTIKVTAVPPSTVGYDLDDGGNITLEILANGRAYHVTSVEVKPMVGTPVAVIFTVSI